MVLTCRVLVIVLSACVEPQEGIKASASGCITLITKSQVPSAKFPPSNSVSVWLLAEIKQNLHVIYSVKCISIIYRLVLLVKLYGIYRSKVKLKHHIKSHVMYDIPLY